jgi:2-keto-4-pentenoate hydratase/2-oxohepta-3-ene-1,7-dioic acid hydratase in catechol pathway
MDLPNSAFALATCSAGSGAPFPAVVLDGRVVPIHALKPIFEKLGFSAISSDSMISVLEKWEENFAALRRVADFLRADGAKDSRWRGLFSPSEQLRFRPPVDLPRQVFCVGANYRQHVIDLIVDQAAPMDKSLSREERRAQAAKLMDDRAAHGAPFIFSKPPSAVTGPFDPVILPKHANKPDWELELAVVISKPCRYVARDQALSYVAGYTIVNDITNRDLVFRKDAGALGADWLAAKGSPSYLPTGPYLVPSAFVSNTRDLQITLKLNGQVMQDESTSDMIFSVSRIVEYLSTHVQLWPGDLIATGSPAGNGTHYNRFLKPGDILDGSITGLGTQRNRCVAEEVEAHVDR